MATYNTVSQVGGILKNVYNKKVVDVVPDNLAVFFDMFQFSGGAEKIGSKFVTEVNFGSENGITVAAGDAGIVDLKAPEAPAIKQAEVTGSQIINSAWVAWDTVTRAIKADSPQAFESLFDRTMKNLRNGHRRAQVLNILYGGDNIGVVSAGANSATQTISLATYAPGIWFASEGMFVDIYDPTLNTKRNGADVKVIGYNTVTRTVTLSATVNTTTDDIIVPRGTVSGAAYVEGIGLSAALGKTSGDLYGLSVTTYPSWKPAQFPVGGALSQEKLDEAVTLGFNKGFTGKYVLLTSGATFNNLHTEQLSRVMTRDYGNSNTPAGLRGIGYRIQGDILVDVVSHPWIKNGESYLVPDDDSWRRIGTVDLTLGDPTGEESIIQKLQGKTGYEITSYSLNSMFSETAYQGVKLTGIVNN
ncbi:hypothetical protein [Ferrovibrio sp.]|uniref:hypothetical protein n=1 Tax=Ferrovibrio sp. TaxID=1917215 RepID=UPI0025C01AAC|nr:hypothetical protein [Ferrovibrio sp.]